MAKKVSVIEYQGNKELNTEDLKYTSILKRLHEKRTLPNINRIERFGKVFILHVPDEKK